ncbi:MAG: ABC transporter permease [Desulfovibrio sp.]|nr:ABC transporter permease [Desulfovibrio sp.]
MNRLVKLIYPGLTLVLAFLFWYFLVSVIKIPKYLLPMPGDVLHRISSDFSFLCSHAAITSFEALSGFFISAVFGITLGALLVMSPLLDKALMPWLILSQTFPKIALAPLIVVWFGMGFAPKVGITMVMAFFPVVISSVVGFRSIEAEMLELARSMRATPFQIFCLFRMPLALPSIFSGLKVSVALSIVGAVIAEWVGADKGLGYLLLSANGTLDTEMLFAVLAFLTVMGVIMYYSVELLERFVIPWHVSIRLSEC